MTHEERIACIFVALIGAIVFSHCMGTVCSLIAQAPAPHARPRPTRARRVVCRPSLPLPSRRLCASQRFNRQ